MLAYIIFDLTFAESGALSKAAHKRLAATQHMLIVSIVKQQQSWAVVCLPVQEDQLVEDAPLAVCKLVVNHCQTNGHVSEHQGSEPHSTPMQMHAH